MQFVYVLPKSYFLRQKNPSAVSALSVRVQQMLYIYKINYRFVYEFVIVCNSGWLTYVYVHGISW